MIEMNVAGIALDAATRLPIVLLKDASERRALPIWIGQTEARAILTALESQKTPRPMTHDLMVSCMDQWDIDLERVVIHSLQDNTFYAVLTLQQGDSKRKSMPVRVMRSHWHYEWIAPYGYWKKWWQMRLFP